MGKWLFLAAIAMLLCSCSLLPQEEEYISKPLIRDYRQSEYKLSYVQFGDVVLTETISCKYMPVQSEYLSFSVGGEFYDEIYVQKGDLVKKGQLLAQLDVSDLLEEIDSLERHISALERSIRDLSEQCALETDAQTRLLSSLSAQERASLRTVEDIQEQYDRQMLPIRDDLQISKLRLEEEQRKLENRRLYANFDGAITYVRDIQPGDRSVEGKNFIGMADASNSVFTAGTKNYEFLPEGAHVSILCNKEYLEAEVVSAKSLGFEETFDKSGAKTMYFRLLSPGVHLETNEHGTLTIVLDESKDTLYIPSGALHTVDDRYFVYQADENGIKVMVDVEVGLMTQKYVEILSGLAEGDGVIDD